MKLLKLRFPFLMRLTGGRSRVILFIFALIIIFVGAFLVYRRPDGRTAKIFARYLPYPAAFAGLSPVWTNEIFTQERYTETYGAKTNQFIPESSAVRSEILNQLIEVRLVERDMRRKKISVSRSEIESSFETIAEENGGREQILSTLKELYGMGEGDFKSLMADQLAIEKFKREVLTSVNVRHILIKDQNKAGEFAKKINEGADFATIAKEQSEDTGSRDAGGSLGTINRGATVKPFEEVAFVLEVGQISEPVQSEFGWHIIKVEERKGVIDKSYADWLAEAKSNTKIVKLLTR